MALFPFHLLDDLGDEEGEDEPESISFQQDDSSRRPCTDESPAMRLPYKPAICFPFDLKKRHAAATVIGSPAFAERLFRAGGSPRRGEDVPESGQGPSIEGGEKPRPRDPTEEILCPAHAAFPSFVASGTS
jgi:hypothetical protein